MESNSEEFVVVREEAIQISIETIRLKLRMKQSMPTSRILRRFRRCQRWRGVSSLHGWARECSCLIGCVKDQGGTYQASYHSRLELCGALVLSKLLCHIQQIFSIPLCNVFGWTDSTIVLHWLSGDPKRFKTYVGNHIFNIVDRIPPSQWRHVRGMENPADCSSHGLFPELSSLTP